MIKKNHFINKKTTIMDRILNDNVNKQRLIDLHVTEIDKNKIRSVIHAISLFRVTYSNTIDDLSIYGYFSLF